MKVIEFITEYVGLVPIVFGVFFCGTFTTVLIYMFLKWQKIKTQEKEVEVIMEIEE